MISAAGPSITAIGDARVAWAGSFLRRTKIDQVPRLWNVARDNMSLVGPRPEDPRYAERYSSEQRGLLSVAPGLTSPATIACGHKESILARCPGPELTYVEEVLPAKLVLALGWLERRSMRKDLRALVGTERVQLAKDRGRRQPAASGTRVAS